MTRVQISGIYRIDVGAGMFYVGSSSDLHRRRLEHLCDLRNDYHANRRMQHAYLQHGEYTFTVIEECARHDLLAREHVWLTVHIEDDRCLNTRATAHRPAA